MLGLAWTDITGGQFFVDTADPDPHRAMHLTLPQRNFLGVHGERVLTEHVTRVLAPFGARLVGWRVLWPRERRDEWEALLHREMPGLVADLVGVDLDGVRERWRTREEKAMIVVHPPDGRGRIFAWDAGARDHQTMQDLAMPAGRRRPQEWRTLADAALHRAGWRRLEEWWSPIPRDVVAHIEPGTVSISS